MEIETKGVQFFGGRWGERIRFILGNVQIDKVNFQKLYIFFIFRGVTILKFTCNIENLSVDSRSLRAFCRHLFIFSLENAADSLS